MFRSGERKPWMEYVTFLTSYAWQCKLEIIKNIENQTFVEDFNIPKTQCTNLAVFHFMAMLNLEWGLLIMLMSG